MILWIQLVSLFILALVLGVFWGTWFSLSRSINKVSAQTFLENGRWFIKNLAGPMALLMPLTLLLLGLDAWLFPDKGSPGFYLVLAALGLFLATLLITLLVEVPIDNRIKRWEIHSLPDNWTGLRQKWQRYHTLRTFTCMGSFSLLLFGTLFYG
ncbi:MAG TPA: DUF1772 domain-containing protein [Edaphocola sp.]|nr:DUF1772 domain-containing protein [Edaphocola sp.]